MLGLSDGAQSLFKKAHYRIVHHGTKIFIQREAEV